MLSAVRTRAPAVRGLPARHPVPRARRQREGRARPSSAAAAHPGRDSRLPQARGLRRSARLPGRGLAPGGQGGGGGLLRGAAGAARGGRRAAQARASGSVSWPARTASPEEAAALDAFGIAPAERWDWDRVSRPHADRSFAGRAAFRAWLLEYLRAGRRTRPAGQCLRTGQGGPRRAARSAQRAAADRRPRRAGGRLPPQPPGPLVHPAQRLPVHRAAAAPDRGDDRADRGGGAGGDRPPDDGPARRRPRTATGPVSRRTRRTSRGPR